MDLDQVADLVHRGRYVTAYRAALEEAGMRQGTDRARALLIACAAAQQLEMFSECRKCAADAVEAAGADLSLQSKARLALGAAVFKCGDAGEAEGVLLSALDCNPEPQVRAAVAHNLGAVYEARRHLQEAAVAYGHAADSFQEIGNRQRECQSRLSLAWVELQQERLPQGRAALQRAADLTEPGSCWQARCLAVEALAARVAGQDAEAVRICEDLLTPGHPGAGPWVRCFAYYLTADMAADSGRLELARQFLGRARAECQEAKDPGLWNRLTELQNRLADT